MGYTTEFFGQIFINPPLSPEEIEFLKKFSTTRRMLCTQGPYYVDRDGGSYGMGQDDDPGIQNRNAPPEGQPGLWCQWIPSSDGMYLEWDGEEKFYHAAEWMAYLINHFLKLEPIAQEELPFLQGHILNGKIEARGAEEGDEWVIYVKDNKTFTQASKITRVVGTEKEIT